MLLPCVCYCIVNCSTPFHNHYSCKLKIIAQFCRNISVYVRQGTRSFKCMDSVGVRVIPCVTETSWCSSQKSEVYAKKVYLFTLHHETHILYNNSSCMY